MNIDYSKDALIPEQAMTIMRDRYMLPTEKSPQDAYARICKAVATDDAHAQRLYNYVSNQWFMFSTPIFTNAGTEKGQLISCFLQHIDDSLLAFADDLLESIVLTASGGGLGSNVSSIRAVGEPTSKGSKSTGAVPWFKVKDSLMLAASQGGTRRGSTALYMDISHPEIEEFIQIRRPTGGDPDRKTMNLHHAVNITDNFMQCVLENKDFPLTDPHSKRIHKYVNARDLWLRIQDIRLETGEPYLHFIDTSNRLRPEALKKLDLEIKQSNLCCLQADERVVTSRGLLTAKELYELGESLEVFDGNNVVKASPMQKVGNGRLYAVKLKNGITHTITKEHKVMTTDGIKQCHELEIGDKVLLQTNKGVFGKTHMPKEAFLLGLYQADGTQHKNSRYIDIWEHSFDLLQEIEGCVQYVYDKYGFTTDRYPVPKFNNCDVGTSPVAKKRLGSVKLEQLGFEKAVIPNWIWEADEETQWQYVRGLFYCDGTVSLNKKANAVYLSITNINKKFLTDLNIILRNLGVSFSLHTSAKAGYKLLPDGNGGKKEYFCQESYRLVCGDRTSALRFEEGTKFLTRKGVSLFPAKYKNSLGYSKIIDITALDEEEEEVYCAEVYTPEHLWVVNGVISHNSEIILPTNSERTAVCCLSSVNLEYFDEWSLEPNFIYDLIEMLDNVLTIFIKNTEGKKGFEKARFSAMQGRDLGLGAFGFHSYLQKNNLPFGSVAAHLKNRNMFRYIRQEAEFATEKLGSLRESCPDYINAPKDADDWREPKPRRNMHLLAIAPNASSSILCGAASPSVEPFNSNIYKQPTDSGTLVFRNKYLNKYIEEHFPDRVEEVWKDITEYAGSIQKLPYFPDEVKEVFKTAKEIDQMWIINHAAVRQTFIDQGQSINLFFAANVDIEYVNYVHVMAWKKGLKTLYYCRGTSVGSNDKVEINHTINECLMCEG